MLRRIRWAFKNSSLMTNVTKLTLILFLATAIGVGISTGHRFLASEDSDEGFYGNERLYDDERSYGDEESYGDGRLYDDKRLYDDQN